MLNMDNDVFLIKSTDLMPVMSSFASLCNETMFHDVTLACSDGKIQCSRVLLALAYSPLAEVLKNREEETLVLIMPDFGHAEIGKLLKTLVENNLMSIDKDENTYDSKKGLIDGEEKLKYIDKEVKKENPVGLEEKIKAVYFEMNDTGKKESYEIAKEESFDTKEFEPILNQRKENETNLIKNEHVKIGPGHTMDTIKSENINKYLCTVCHYKTNHKSSFDSHMERKHRERAEGLVCTRPWCETTFITKHDREEHKKNCLLECGVCGKKFDRQDHLNGHMRGEARKALKDAAQSKWETFSTWTSIVKLLHTSESIHCVNKWVHHARFYILVPLNLTICKKRSKLRPMMAGHKEET